MTELRVAEVNILQVRASNTLQLGAFEHMSFSATKSFAINCQNVLVCQHASGMNTLLQQRGKCRLLIHQRKYWNQSLVAEENLFTIILDKSAGKCNIVTYDHVTNT